MEKQKPASLAEYRNKLEADIKISGTMDEMGRSIDERVDARLRFASVVFPEIITDENSPDQNATAVITDFEELEKRLRKIRRNAKLITAEELKMLRLEAPGEDHVIGRNDVTTFLVQPDGKYVQVYFRMNEKGRIESYRAYLLDN